MKLFLTSLLFISSIQTFANCVVESKDFDGCLQCCSDTALAIQILDTNKQAAMEIISSCKNESTQPSMRSIADLDSMYKLEYSAYRRLCNDKTFIQTSKFTALPYEECTQACNKKFRSKK